ncbi:MAG TPA: 2TM domain-containing protein [Chitinophagaceae bacterium]|nr:2TM domain-containing protein [Chitinophagaceae bacterium]
MDNEKNEEGMSPQESLRLIGQMMDKVQDDALWKIAKKRSLFKTSVIIYLVINGFLVGLWYFTTGVHSYFWPAWPMLGWGLGLVFQFLDAYMTNGVFSEEKEFERLKQKARENKK